MKGREWIRLLFAYPSTLNNGAPIGSAHCILAVTDQVSPYEAIAKRFLLRILDQWHLGCSVQN